MGSGERLRGAVARIVVQEPARAPLRTGFPRPLEILSLQGEREPIARRKRGARRPDLEVDFDDLTGLELLRLVVGVPRLPFGRALRVELSLGHAQPALRNRRFGLDRREEGDLLSVR